jgi:hypothetical protein
MQDGRTPVEVAEAGGVAFHEPGSTNEKTSEREEDGTG